METRAGIFSSFESVKLSSKKSTKIENETAFLVLDAVPTVTHRTCHVPSPLKSFGEDIPRPPVVVLNRPLRCAYLCIEG